MKLVKQTRLHFQEGRSDKVYEVDLCETGPDRYVVNFRYGRRGATLKESAKTTAPVSLAQAEKLFAELVASKTKKGYQETSDAAAETVEWGARRLVTTAQATGDPRQQAILNHLKKGGKGKTHWPLERVIWRAGELKITEAAPLLLKLIGSGTALRDYCIAWALGFCGDAQAAAALDRLYQNAATPEMTRRMAHEALIKLSDDATRAAFRDARIDSLPPELSFLARQGTADDFARALADYLQADDGARYETLETVYLIDNANVRPALLNVLRQAPLKANAFRALRHIFKAAEYRRDGEVFGLLAYRFEKSRANFNTWKGLDKNSRYLMYVHLGRDAQGNPVYFQDARKEIQSPDSKLAYSSRTRAYLRRRVWRTLSRLGSLGDLDYVKMAVGVLLPFSDADAQAVKAISFRSLETGAMVTRYWDTFSVYSALNHLLYQHSPRYILPPSGKVWRCEPPYKPGDAAPAAREEAFPRLWEQRPEGLLHLIAESECTPVQEFATRALASCEDFCAGLDTDTVRMILERPYVCAARLGFELARRRYDALAPDRELTLALAGCALEEARAEAHRWISRSPGHFAGDLQFITALVFNLRADTRAFARHWLQTVSLPPAFADDLIDKLVARFDALDSAQASLARDVADTVLQAFAPRLRSLRMGTILALLAHPLREAQELGGTILLGHEQPASALPEAVINSLIASPFESLRGIGLSLFGQLEDETLLGREAIIAALATHELADVRARIRPVIRRLAVPPALHDPRLDEAPAEPAIDPLTPERRDAFARKLAMRFLDVLWGSEPHAGVHADLVRIMSGDLGSGWMDDAGTGTAWKLIHAASLSAQELGGILLEYKANRDYRVAGETDFSELVELSDHEVLAVRQASWVIFAKMLHRLQQAMNPDHHLAEMAKAIKLLDTAWDDSRGFWFRLFELHFTANDFTPALLVSICDSVRKDVQGFGRKLIARFFAEADGQEYLLKLSEHPSAELQLFATNYLERYAADNPARLAELKPYFLSVLSRVNKARVAKDRVMAFLASEAQKDEAAARLVTEILTRQALTIARGDRAAAIEALLAIHRAFPQIATPLAIKPPEVRHAF